MNKLSYIHLIRHSITEGNQKGWYYGQTDVPLTEEGLSLLKTLTEEGIYPKPESADFYTSGLLRAEQTFAFIYGDTAHTRLDSLNEMNFGEYEMKTHHDLKEDPIYRGWIGDKSGETVPPGGESIRQFIKRICSGFAGLLEKHLEKGVDHSILVCHGGVISAIMMHYFKEEKKHMFAWTPEPGHGYTLTFESGNPTGYHGF